MAVRIGELLLKEKLITPEQLQQALTQQKANGGKLGYNLVKMGFVKDEQITTLLSKQYGVPSINLAQFKIDPTIVKLVPTETARKYQVIPLSRSGSTLTIAMTDPTNVFAMDDIKFMTGYNVEPVVASEVALRKAIDRHYGTPRSVVLREKTRSSPGYSPGEGSLDDVMASSALTADDMAGIGFGEINMDEITGVEAGADVDVVKGEEGEEIDWSGVALVVRRNAGLQAGGAI